MTKAIHDAGELKHHRRIDGAVVTRKHINGRQQLAAKLFKNQMLILHLVAEASGLEQPLTVPLQGRDGRRSGGNSHHRNGEPRVQQGQVVGSEQLGFDRLKQTIVFRMKHIMDRRQCNVFVAAPVTGDVVKIQQFVVVEAGGRWGRGRIDHSIGISGLAGRRCSAVGNVVEKSVACSQGTGGGDGVGGRPFQQAAVFEHQLGETVGARDQVAVKIGEQQRNVQGIGIDQGNAQARARLLFHFTPVGDRICGSPIEETAAGLRPTGHQDVVAKEGLVGRMGGVGLVLVDPGGGGVAEQPHVISCAQQTIWARFKGSHLGPGEHHEIGGAPRDIERIVGLQRNDDRTTATFPDQVQTMVKELPEECEQRVIGSRQAQIGRDIGNEDGPLARDRGREATAGGRGGGVIGGLIGDQVADGAGLGIKHHPRGLLVRAGGTNAEGTWAVGIETGRAGRAPDLGEH